MRTTTSGLVELMRAQTFHLMGTAPEGVSSVFSSNEPIGPFTRVGLKVAALAADADTILAVQKGVEAFGRPVRLPAGAFLPVGGLFPFLGSPRGMLLPLWYPGRKAHVRLKYPRHRPLVSPEERASLSDEERRALNDDEFARMREKMVSLTRSIPDL